MPTYVYECKTCNTVFEADQSIKDDPLDTCVCGAVGTVKRVIQPVGIAFKGSGFYVNDSKSGPAPSSAKPSPVTETPSVDSPTPAPTPAASPAPETPTTKSP